MPLIAALFCVCAGASTGWSATRSDAAGPIFPVPAVLFNQAPGSFLVAEAGKRFTYAFCMPAPAVGHLCGGPLAKPPTLLPFGGHGGPYKFTNLAPGQHGGAGGLPPLGLHLNANTGTLSGTINAQLKTKRWTFHVCAWSGSFLSGSSCRTTAIDVVAAAPKPTPAPPYDGTWDSDWQGTTSTGGWWGGTGGSCIGGDCSSDGLGEFTVKNGVITSTEPASEIRIAGTIANNGAVTITATIPGWYGAQPTVCIFQAQFENSGTADNVGAVSCQAPDNNGVPSTFTGTFHADRSS
jgi:hypothetical protein